MSTVNVLEAKTHLSRLLDAVESGAEDRVVIARNGRPIAQLVPLSVVPVRIGVRAGLEIPDDIDLDNEEIARELAGTA